MPTYASGLYNFNPGLGYLTETRKRGQEYLTKICLGDNAPNAGYIGEDTIVLMNTRTTNRLSRLVVMNDTAAAVSLKFSIGFYDSNGNLQFPTYNVVAAAPNDYCDCVLGCGIGANGLATGVSVAAKTCANLWGVGGYAAWANNAILYGFRGSANDGAVGTLRSLWSFVRPQTYSNIGQLLDATLKGPLLTRANDIALAAIGGAPYPGADIAAGSATGLGGNYETDFGTFDTKIAIVCRVTTNPLTKANANHIWIEIGDITSHTSMRGDGDDYIKHRPSKGLADYGVPNPIPGLP